MDLTKTILIDNRDSFTYNIVECLRQIKNLEFGIVDVDNIRIPELSTFDNIIISPGSGLPAEYPILSKIIDEYKSGKAILGICLGHQAICEHFGARLINLESVFHGHQEGVEIVQAEPIYTNLSPHLKVGLYHSWAVDSESIPPELQVTAKSEKGYVMSVRHAQYKIYGVQFHPESFLTEYGIDMINNFLHL